MNNNFFAYDVPDGEFNETLKYETPEQFFSMLEENIRKGGVDFFYNMEDYPINLKETAKAAEQYLQDRELETLGVIVIFRRKRK